MLVLQCVSLNKIVKFTLANFWSGFSVRLRLVRYDGETSSAARELAQKGKVGGRSRIYVHNIDIQYKFSHAAWFYTI